MTFKQHVASKGGFSAQPKFQGKVNLLMKKKGFYPGKSPAQRKAAAGGVVHNYVQRNEQGR